MKKAKKFLSLFLSAALAVAGINIGSPATVNAAATEEHDVTIMYVDSTGDNAQEIKTAETKSLAFNDFDAYKYNVPENVRTITKEDRPSGRYEYVTYENVKEEVTATVPSTKNDGSKNDGSKNDGSKNDGSQDAGKTYKYTIKLVYKWVEGPATGQGETYKVRINYKGSDGKTLRDSKDLVVTPDNAGGYIYDPSDQEKEDITTEDGTYVYDATGSTLKIGKVATGDDASKNEIVLMYKLTDSTPVNPATDTYKVTIKYVGSDGKTLRDSKDLVVTPDDAGGYEYEPTEEEKKDITKDGKTYVYDAVGSKLKIDRVATGDDASQNEITLKYNVKTVPVSKTKLNEAITAAKKLTSKPYTAASWATFQTALKNAEAVYNNNNATQAQVDDATTTLTNAQKNLKKLVTKLTITNKLTGKSSGIQIAAGKKVTLVATAAPTDAANKKVTWSIDKKYKNYATVSKSGVVTTKAKGAGKTIKVKATAQDGSEVSKSVTIKIMGKTVTSVKFKNAPKSVKAGKSVTLKTTIKSKGKGKLNKTLKWTSSNTKIATVSSKGKVTVKKTAKKGQKVTITATATDGSGKKAKVKITVKK